jgi:hypothetical protein
MPGRSCMRIVCAKYEQSQGRLAAPSGPTRYAVMPIHAPAAGACARVHMRVRALLSLQHPRACRGAATARVHPHPRVSGAHQG